MNFEWLVALMVLAAAAGPAGEKGRVMLSPDKQVVSGLYEDAEGRQCISVERAMGDLRRNLWSKSL